MKGVCPRFKIFDGYNFLINPLDVYPSKNKMAASEAPKSIGQTLISYPYSRVIPRFVSMKEHFHNKQNKPIRLHFVLKFEMAAIQFSHFRGFRSGHFVSTGTATRRP